MSKLKKLVIFLLILVVALPATAFGYVYFKLNGIHDPSADNELLSSTDYKSEKGITNILLVGTDGRSKEENGTRSDSMMILTVDNKNKSIKLTSLARDTYVDIPGRGKEKLTHAYAYGGINLLIETIEDNFELDIQNYAVVDFFSFMDIIDTLGGVTVSVNKGELAELQKYTYESYTLNKNPNKGSLKIIESEGTHKLNGYQALGYARIRYNDSAMERDRRQREIMQAMINSFKDLPVSKYPSLVDSILPYVKTNMRPTKIMGLCATILGIGNFNISQLEFPVYNNGGGKVDGKGWVLQFDKNKNIPLLHDFIFNNIIPKDIN